jgi:hypothetical protein
MDGVVQASGGTSASTPFFAGVVALLNQYVVANGVQAKPGLGNINPRLYQLAQITKGIFHDVTAGDNIVPCKTGTPDCTNGQYGYKAGPGYDHVTGLGSIDVANLVQNWATAESPSSAISEPVVSVDPSPVYQQSPDADGYSWFYTVKLRETGGAPSTIQGFYYDEFYDLSENIVDWFGSTTLPANGMLSVDLRAKDVVVPSNHSYGFVGVDTNSGKPWAKLVNVTFLGPKGTQKGAGMTLTSDPATVVKIGKGDPDCSPNYPYGQELHR